MEIRSFRVSFNGAPEEEPTIEPLSDGKLISLPEAPSERPLV